VRDSSVPGRTAKKCAGFYISPVCCPRSKVQGDKAARQALPLQNGKGETAEGDVSVPVRRLLGRSRICCGLSHQWSAITGDTRNIEYTGIIP